MNTNGPKYHCIVCLCLSMLEPPDAALFAIFYPPCLSVYYISLEHCCWTPSLASLLAAKIKYLDFQHHLLSSPIGSLSVPFIPDRLPASSCCCPFPLGSCHLGTSLKLLISKSQDVFCHSYSCLLYLDNFVKVQELQ